MCTILSRNDSCKDCKISLQGSDTCLDSPCLTKTSRVAATAA